MGTYLNPGNSSFSGIRNDHYVDKTGLIGLINDSINTPRRLTCVSRPRRFGKSFAAQMLCAYYDKADSSSLFEGLRIAEDESYQTHLNKYNVIYLDMTNIMGEAGKTGIIPFIRRKVTEELLAAYPALTADESFSATLVKAAELSGTKFIMIIDEWDAPVRETPEIQREYLEFLRTLFKSSATTDRIFAAAYITGILPIKKDGAQSAISNFQEYTVLDADKFAEYAGFSEEEVIALCKEYGMDFAAVKKWYDGYRFHGMSSVYNPYSVMNAMRRKRLQSYWKKTSAAEALQTYIDMDEDGLQDEILRLISGERIRIDTDGFENDFQTFHNKDDVLTLLVHLGYLTYDEDGKTAEIPNEEVRMEFKRILRRARHPKLLELVRASDSLLDDTIHRREEAVAKGIDRVRNSAYAPAFYNDEQALRAVIRSAYITCADQYLKIEELPSGHGLADLVFIPLRDSRLPAMLIELKWDRSADGAIRQIKDRNYPAVLKDYGGEILLVGINYSKKTKRHACRIERVSLD